MTAKEKKAEAPPELIGSQPADVATPLDKGHRVELTETMATKEGVQKQDEVLDVIRCHRIEVVDSEGRIRVIVGDDGLQPGEAADPEDEGPFWGVTLFDANEDQSTLGGFAGGQGGAALTHRLEGREYGPELGHDRLAERRRLGRG